VKSLESQLLKLAKAWKKTAYHLHRKSDINYDKHRIDIANEQSTAAAYLSHCALVLEDMIKINKKKGKKS